MFGRERAGGVLQRWARAAPGLVDGPAAARERQQVMSPSGKRQDLSELAAPLHLLITQLYRGTSLVRNSAPLGPYSRNMPRPLRWS